MKGSLANIYSSVYNTEGSDLCMPLAEEGESFLPRRLLVSMLGSKLQGGVLLGGALVKPPTVKIAAVLGGGSTDQPAVCLYRSVAPLE